MSTRRTLDLLRRYESRNVTFIKADGSWPIVWQRANGVHVWDAAGKKYLDLTAGFGVAAAGHANPKVVRTGQKQMATLLHAMGDVHPHALKGQLARELSRITFERWATATVSHPAEPTPDPSQEGNGHGARPRRVPSHGAAGGGPTRATGKTIFCNSGFEAVEAALKTAILATGQRGVIAFEEAYHGLGYGALSATHREHFRAPFRSQLGGFEHCVPFPGIDPDHPAVSQGQKKGIGGFATAGSGERREMLHKIEARIDRLLRREKIGAILIEPIQARGGINVPPKEFLPMLRRLCDRYGALLILDEIYTGLGRTGKWFACEHSGVVPDIICLGKALTGGFPLSACVGRADLMDAAWPKSTGEAIHTSTFLGHPVGCAMALAQIAEIRRFKLPERSARLGSFLLNALVGLASEHPGLQLLPRGIGLMAGLELRNGDGSPATAPALDIIKNLLHRGFILLPEGEHSNVISFTPPLTISEAQLRTTVNALAEELGSIVPP